MLAYLFKKQFELVVDLFRYKTGADEKIIKRSQ